MILLSLTLVLIGGHDLQVDLHADGDPLQAAADDMPNMTFAFPPHSDTGVMASM